MEDLTALPGMGPVNVKKLNEAGIHTPDQLRSLGSEEAFCRVRQTSDPGACLHMLYGLEAAVQGIPKKDLPQQDKDRLRQFFVQIEREDKGRT